jgi:hypothetical protein
MAFVYFLQKVKNRIWRIIVEKFRNTFFYPCIYRSYWNSIINRKNFGEKSVNFYTAIPNVGAGIGHQMANWIAGYWYAKTFQLTFAHSSFPSPEWDSFLGLGENERRVNELIKNGYKKVRLPLFDEFSKAEVELQKKIILSYANQSVVFFSEQDQGYADQFGVIDSLQEKFFNSPSRKMDQLIFDSKFINICIHIRRGDILNGRENKDFLMRWQGNEYFLNVLRSIIAQITSKKPIAIYLISQGSTDDFVEFCQFPNLQFCSNLPAMNSFLHMVFADILITSKSSFSYKPALLNKGIKICPKDFWHGYPPTADWLVADESGIIMGNLPKLNV